MKKYLLCLFALILMCPIFAHAQTDVTVKSIEKDEENSTPGVEVTPAKAEGLTLSVDVKFKNVNDKIRYIVVVENKDTEDNQLNTGKEFDTSKYIKYTYEFDNGSNILKANSTKTMYITLTYEVEVDDDDLRPDGSYQEENDMTIGVLKDDALKEENPKTGKDEIIVIAVVLGLVIIAGAVMLKNKQTKYLVLTLGAILVLVPTVSALKQITITMSTNITIEKEKEFCVYVASSGDKLRESEGEEDEDEDYPVAYYKFTPGMTFEQYYAAHPTGPQLNLFYKKPKVAYEACTAAASQLDPEEAQAAGNACDNEYLIIYESNEDLLSSEIKDKSQGCYEYEGMEPEVSLSANTQVGKVIR